MKKRSFEPFPQLTTERLLLRKAVSADCETIFRLRSDPEVTKYIKRDLYKQVSEAISFWEKVSDGIATGKDMYWAVCLKEDQKMIGSFSLWNFTEEGDCGELGYDLGTGFHRKGIMTEAMKAVMNYAFQSQDFRALQAYTDVRNEASKRLLLKNGLQLRKGMRDPNNEHNRIFRIEREAFSMK